MTSPPTSILELPPGDPPLADLIAQIDHPLPEAAVERLACYRDLLRQRNERTNLTAVRDAPGIDRRLIVESLRLAPPITAIIAGLDNGEIRLLDLGTGGGVPGVVLAIAFPDVSFTLLDATRKKTDFLDEVIRDLGLHNASTLNGRAEELAHQPQWRNQFDLVTARAVASLPTILELAAPFLRTGGSMLLPKGTGIDDELAQAKRAAPLLGVEVVSAAILPDAGSTIVTQLVTARKVATTPRNYPRRPGIPAKQPLGVEPASRSGRKGGPQ